MVDVSLVIKVKCQQIIDTDVNSLDVRIGLTDGKEPTHALVTPAVPTIS